MAEIIRMPKMSDTMEEGVIAQWLKKEGDDVVAGDILAEVETDKATMELESYEDGTLLHLGVKDGESVPVNGLLAIIGKKGEDISSMLKEAESQKPRSPSESDDKELTGSDREEVVESERPGTEIDTSGINASVITMPKMSDTMTEGTIAAWLKNEGDEVQAGDILAEVETDKATMELESYEDGVLLYIGPKAGNSIPVDGVLAVVGEKGADFKTLLKARESKKASSVGEVSSEPENVPTVNSPESAQLAIKATPVIDQPQIERRSNGRIKASPLAKSLAKEKGYDINLIKGSGDGGRIVKRDVESYIPSVAGADAGAGTSAESVEKPVLPVITGEEQFEDVPLSQMRKIIAGRLAESKFTSPHFYLTMEISMDKTIEARKSMNEVSPVKISFNDMIIKAASVALRQNPKVNVSWREDKLRYNKHIHIGVAVAVEEGLLVPVVRFADSKTLSHIAAEVKDLATRAHEKKLQPPDWEGSTFTISNLGMFGIEEFTAIINPPDACILAVGGIKQTAVVRDGELVPGSVMKVTLSCDHRAVDGAVGSAFLQSLKELLEDPVRLLI